MSNVQQNIALVRRLFDEFYSKSNLSIGDQLFASNVKLNDPAAPNFKGGLSQLKDRETVYKTAFPNKTLKIDDIFGTDNDVVVVRWTCQATQKGELQGIPASNKNVKITGISIYHIINGKIAEIDQNWDRLALLEQIGAIEPAVALHR